MGLSLIVFVFVYLVVFVAGFWYMGQAAWQAPEDAAAEAAPPMPQLAGWLGAGREAPGGSP